MEQLNLGRIWRLVAQTKADSDLPCSLRSTGIVGPFRSEGERDRYPTAACGEPLNHKQMRQKLPGLARSWTTGLLFAQDGKIYNHRQLMRTLENTCEE